MGKRNKISNMEKRKIFVIGIVFVALTMISFSSAYEWVCLGYGESLPLDSRGVTCWKTLCITCVSDSGFSSKFSECSGPPCESSGNTTFDVTPPEINVSYPAEGGLYQSRKVLFDVESNEPFSLYYIDNIRGRRQKRLGSNIESHYSRTVRLKDGFNSVTIKARDRNNNWMNVTRTFTIDSKKPKISRIEPRRGVTNGLLSLDFVEENPKEIVLAPLEIVYDSDWIEANCDVNVKDARKRHCEVDVRAEFEEFDGEVIGFSFSVEDVVGNVYTKRVKKIVVDTSEPILLNEDLFWSQGVGRYAKYIYFNLSIDEANLDEVTYSYIDRRDRIRVKKLCSRLKDGVCYKKKSFRRGEEILGIQILDEAGNSVAHGINFLIDY